jgi:hypothetical protein
MPSTFCSALGVIARRLSRCEAVQLHLNLSDARQLCAQLMNERRNLLGEFGNFYALIASRWPLGTGFTCFAPRASFALRTGLPSWASLPPTTTWTLWTHDDLRLLCLFGGHPRSPRCG